MVRPHIEQSRDYEHYGKDEYFGKTFGSKQQNEHYDCRRDRKDNHHFFRENVGKRFDQRRRHAIVVSVKSLFYSFKRRFGRFVLIVSVECYIKQRAGILIVVGTVFKRKALYSVVLLYLLIQTFGALVSYVAYHYLRRPVSHELFVHYFESFRRIRIFREIGGYRILYAHFRYTDYRIYYESGKQNEKKRSLFDYKLSYLIHGRASLQVFVRYNYAVL